MEDKDDIDFGADISPSVLGRPLGFLEPTTPAVRAAQRARRRGDVCPSPEELRRANGAVHGNAALRTGEVDWEPPPTLL